jgi:hypothetical protein
MRVAGGGTLVVHRGKILVEVLEVEKDNDPAPENVPYITSIGGIFVVSDAHEYNEERLNRGNIFGEAALLEQ